MIRKIAANALLVVLVVMINGLGLFHTAQAQKKDSTRLFRNIKFTNLGPAVAGGRVSSVQGVPGKPDVYYVGAGGGGVWKTTDGGDTWKDIFKDQPEASIGDVTVAPSNSNLVWVGTGEANIRNDIVDGHGVYFSPDAGATWKFMGLKDAGQISKVVVNPEDPETVFVAAIGNAWSPNKQRGLFKSTDGGKNWKKVLFVNDSTGVTDVIYKPGNPKIMFAATYKVMRRPWTLINGGTTSRIYKSTDGGATWHKVTNGLPKGNVGRIAFGASKSNPDHIYALIAAKNGTLYDSEDGGRHWKKVSNNHELNVRPFYFSTLAVDPTDDNHLYFLSYQMTESKDGGKSVKHIGQGVHVDYHAIWIDPTNPDRIIVGNDGGAYISRTAGKTWHFNDNIPIEQFYMVAADSSMPYNVTGGLQDNNAWFGPSRKTRGRSITGQRWSTVAGGDGQYVVPAPTNPDIMYAESQNGFIRRINRKTGQTKFVKPAVRGVSSTRPKDLEYRFNWTTPIAVSYTDANTVYMGANKVFKTTDGGQSWKVISPDLTRNNKKRQVVAGGPVAHDISGAETYGTIISLGLSKKDPDVIWAGTDDGQIQLTRDGGQHWNNVSGNVPHLKPGGRIYQVGVSPFDPGTCYITVDYHMMGNDHPYVFKTDDYGQSWTSINEGLPADYPAHVVREDPNKKGFLVLGTDNALYYSRNDGESWTKFKNKFPTAPVYDVQFVKDEHDLVVATHGRGLFVAHNIRTLEEMNDDIKNSKLHLFSIQLAVLDISEAQISYFLKDSLKTSKKQKKAGKTPVQIKIKNAEGKVINTLYGPSKAGNNQFQWNLRKEGAKRLKTAESSGRSHHGPKANNSRGPKVLPGTYQVSVIANGKTETGSLVVKSNPNYPSFDRAGAQKAREAMARAVDDMDAMNTMLNEIHELKTQIGNWKKTISNQENSDQYQPLVDRADSLDKKLTDIRNEVRQTKAQKGVGEDGIHYRSHLYGSLRRASYSFYSYDQAPSKRAMNNLQKLEGELHGYVDQFNTILRDDVSGFNKKARAQHLPILLAGKPIQYK